MESSCRLARPARRSRVDPGARRIGRRGGARRRRGGRFAEPARGRERGPGCRRRHRGGRGLVRLGSALVHATKGQDEEGAAALHRASRDAEESGDRRWPPPAIANSDTSSCSAATTRARRCGSAPPRSWPGGDPLEIARIQAAIATCLADVGLHDQAASARSPGRDRAGSAGGPRTGRPRGRWRSSAGRTSFANEFASGRGHARRSARRRERAVDGLHRVPRGTGGRGMGPQRRSGPGLRGVRARVRAGMLGERRVLGGLRGPWARPAPCRPRRPGGSIELMEDALIRCAAPARHAPLAARVRPRRALRGDRGGRHPHGGGMGHRPRLAGRPLGHARALRPRLSLPVGDGRGGCARCRTHVGFGGRERPPPAPA